jgi:hypothetical protein
MKLGNFSNNAEYYGIQVSTCDTITYIRNYKCASSFFYKNLVDRYKWREIPYNEINWAGKVFSHIREPLDRRHRGLTHWLLYTFGTGLDDPKIEKIIKNISFIEQHSASYWDTFGDDCYKIDWIPIDKFNNNKVIELTCKLLADNGQHILRGLDESYDNKSSDDERKLYLKIKEQFEAAWKEPFDEYPNYTIYRYFLKDIELYNSVIKNFNPTALTWAGTSWLRK